MFNIKYSTGKTSFLYIEKSYFSAQTLRHSSFLSTWRKETLQRRCVILSRPRGHESKSRKDTSFGKRMQQDLLCPKSICKIYCVPNLSVRFTVSQIWQWNSDRISHKRHFSSPLLSLLTSDRHLPYKHL